MKKILLASTALVLSAGLANAQAVSIGGEGRMGIIYDNAGFGGGTNTMIENRLQLNFSVSVQADHGLSFGAFTRARMQMGGAGIGGVAVNQPTVFSGSRVWVEANGLRVTFGNTDGAFRGAGASHGYLGGCYVGYVGGYLCGDTAGLLGVTQGFNSTGQAQAQRVRVDYSAGSYRVALSADRGGSVELGVRGTFGAFTAALGYTDGAGGADSMALSGHYNGGSWGVGLLVADVMGTTNFSLTGTAQLGGGTAQAYVGDVFGVTTYGLGYSYGLGGGATLSAGYEGNDTGRDTLTVGVAFSF